MNNKRFVLISIVVVLLIAIIVLIFQLTKKKRAKIVIAPIDSKIVSNNDISEEESKRCLVMAQRLYDDMSGFNLWGHDNDVYRDFDQMSDRELSIVYACFNENFGDGESLTQWLINEKFRISNLTDSIILRLQKLNLF